MASPEFTIAEQVLNIPLDQLFISKTNPRRAPSQETLQDLASDIAIRGVTQAILSRPHNGRYEVVYGQRRFLASGMAKKQTIPSVVRELTDEEVFDLQVVENLQREELHPLEESAAFQRLYKKAYSETKSHDDAIRQVAERLGKKHKPQYIAKRLKLQNLIEPVKADFRDDVLLEGHAEELARLRPEEQTSAYEWLKSHHVEGANRRKVQILPGVPELRHWVQEHIFLDLTKAPFDINDPTLNPKIGACVSCQFKTGNQPALFGDVRQNDTCTVPSCWREKRNNRLIQITNAHAKELGVKKVLKIGLGYESWNRDGIPVDAYVEFGSPFGVVKPGNECKLTKPGVVTFIGHPGDAAGNKVGSPLLVCTNVQDCSKHNGRSGNGMRAKKSYEEIANTRITNLQTETRQRVRSAIISAVIRAAMKQESVTPRKVFEKFQVIARQMHQDLFFDRHRDLCKLMEVEPKLDRYKNKDWRATCKHIFDNNPIALMVAMTVMHCYHVGTSDPGHDPVGFFVRHYKVDASRIEKEVKTAIGEKIGSIRSSLKRRQEKERKSKKK